MHSADVVILGAGPAGFAALAGLGTASSLKVAQLSGGVGAGLGGTWLGGGLGRAPVAAELGLPQVRAFGAGGTTALWHGGLFVPSRHDEIVSEADGFATGADLLPQLRGLLATGVAQPADLIGGVYTVLDSKGAGAAPDAALRSVYIPRTRPKIDAAALHAAGSRLSGYSLTDEVAVDVVQGGGRLQVMCAGPSGFRVIDTGHLMLAAGVLGSGVLVRRLLGLPELRFGDHYHVFAGVVPSDLAARLLQPAPVKGAGFHHNLKFSVELACGERADVSFSFRRVSNPDFPRSGRRFGKFVGANALSKWEKLALVARNPMTGMEMLAYRWGVQLPLASSLVHSTVALRSRAGVISADGIAPNTPREKIGEAVGMAWEQLCQLIGPQRSRVRLFSSEQIRDSAISGAQFVGSLSDAAGAYRERLGQVSIADCSRFAFTSVYNQGLVSLAAGFAATAGKF